MPAGTNILLPDYTTINIEKLKEGDLVLGFDEYPPFYFKKRKTKISKVLSIKSRVSDVIEIRTDRNKSIIVTKDHPILSGRSGKFSWKNAGKYKINDKIRVVPKIPRKAIEKNIINKAITYSEKIVSITYKGVATVYNIETTSSTFIANNFCVHNCYLHNNGKSLFQGNYPKAKNVLENTEKIMNFLYKNKMSLVLEFFAGELFMLPYIWDFLEIVYKYQKKTKREHRVKHIMIPTNMSFIKNGREDIREKLEDYLRKFKELDIRVNLSASVDGSFMDYLNRPYANPFSKYDSGFYEKLKKELRSNKFGIHPMIHNKNIEYWIDNFLWFMIKDGLSSVYLLEVRNAQWSEHQAKTLHYFIRFIINYMYKIVGFNKNKFLSAFEKLRGFNMLNQLFSRVGRGMGCSIQSSLHIQVDSLKLSPCHRISYKNFVTGQFEFNEDGSYDFIADNPELFLAEQNACTERMVPCDTCAINQICTGPCIGANFESVGDPFTIPPTLCRMFYMKYSGIILGLKDIGMLDHFMKQSRWDKKRISQINHIVNILEKEK